MSSLPKQETVLDRISFWPPGICGECESLIDAIWLKQDWTTAADANFCPVHALGRAPRSEHQALGAALQRVREMRDVLRLSDPRVRHTLGVDGFPPLPSPPLFGYRLPVRAEGCDINVFDVRGLSVLSADDLVSEFGSGSLPMYHPDPLLPPPGPAQSDLIHKRLFPERYAEQVPIEQSILRVELAFTASLPTKPESPRILSWQPSDPSADYVQTQVESPSQPLTDKEALQLRAAIEVLYHGKRGPGRTPLAAHHEELRAKLIALADQFIESQKRAADSKEDFCKAVGIPTSTLSDHLRASGLGPWSRFQQQFVSGPRISRQARQSR